MCPKAIKSVEVKTIKSLYIKLNPKYTNGHEFCELIVDESINGFTARLYGGETYSFSWSAPGNDYIQFLINTFTKHNDYLFGKLENISHRNLVDTEKTAHNMKKLVLDARYNLNIEKDEARELWEEIESFEGYDELTDSHFYDLYHTMFEIGIKREVFSDEPLFEDFVEHKEDWKCRVFCEKVAPILAEVLKREYSR